MSGSISASLRRLVVNRAARLCEYCLVHEDDRVEMWLTYAEWRAKVGLDQPETEEGPEEPDFP